MSTTVLYFTQERWDEHYIGSRMQFFGHRIEVLNRWMRRDLGDYFEITYRYIS